MTNKNHMIRLLCVPTLSFVLYYWFALYCILIARTQGPGLFKPSWDRYISLFTGLVVLLADTFGFFVMEDSENLGKGENWNVIEKL